jgi:hypothetical protein
MSVLGAIVAICAGVVSIATGVTALWKKITESETKQELAKKEEALATTSGALSICQRTQAWQWVGLVALMILVLFLASRSVPRAA